MVLHNKKMRLFLFGASVFGSISISQFVSVYAGEENTQVNQTNTHNSEQLALIDQFSARNAGDQKNNYNQKNQGSNDTDQQLNQNQIVEPSKTDDTIIASDNSTSSSDGSSSSKSSSNVSFSSSNANKSNSSSSSSKTNSSSTNSSSSSSSSQNNDVLAKLTIINIESKGNYSAQNGQYYGAYQMNINKFNGDLSPENQDKVAEQYVMSRYGSWTAALQHHQQYGWY